MANGPYFVTGNFVHTVEIHLRCLFCACGCSFASKLLPAASDTGVQEVQEGSKYREQGTTAPLQTKAGETAWQAHPAKMDGLGSCGCTTDWLDSEVPSVESGVVPARATLMKTLL